MDAYFGSFITLLSIWNIIYAQDCGNEHFGENNPSSKDDRIDSNTAFGYLMEETSYIIDCCGIVDQWEAEFDNVVGNPTIYFQIWRPGTGSTYTLVGQNAETVPGNNEHQFPITQASRITVKPDDRFGWWTAGSDVITYKSGGGEEDNNVMMTLGSQAEGDTVDWSGATTENDRSYAIRVDMQNNNDPEFTNLANTVTVSNSIASGTPLFTVTVDDIDTYDVDTLVVAMTTTNSDYSFDTGTLIVSTAASLSGPGRTETLTFRVTDQCGNSVTASLTVVITNEPPVIHNLPSSVYLSEDETVKTLLFTINATDTDSSVTCIDVTSPTTYPFQVQQIPASEDYGIYNDESPGFDYAVKNEYDLTVQCSDGDLSVTGDFTVYLVKNAAPVIVNLQNSTSISTTNVIGYTAFTVLVTDAENDDIIMSMTCDPSPCPFEIFDSGDIQISEDLSDHTTVGYDIEITVSDSKNTVGPSILTITLADINDPILITNLPISTSVTENTAVGTPVYTVSYSDQDTSQTHTFVMSSTPGSGLSYFDIDSTTGEITTTSEINYEALSALGTTSFALSVTVSDPVTSDTQSLTVEIVNENEAPVFSPTSYTITATEGSAGTVIGTPLFGVTDPDSGDSQTYTMDCGSESGYFFLNRASGQVSYQSNYDLDAGSLPTSVTCTVTVTDSQGLTDTASLTILIDDVNDNTPIFSPASYTFYVSYYAAAGTGVGTVIASDLDSGTYGTITYTLDQSSLLVEHFSIDNNGNIVVQTSPFGSAMGYATSVTITATATDTGGLLDTANVVIIVSDTTTTSTTTTTDRYRTFLEDTKNIAWLAACAVFGLVSICVLVYIVYTCHGDKGCARCSRSLFKKKKSSYKPRRRRRPSSTDFSRFSETPRYHPPKPPQAPFTVRHPPPPIEAQNWRA